MLDIDPQEKVIEVNGILLLCERLGVEPTDPVMLVLAAKCDCKTNCVFTKREFLDGMQRIEYAWGVVMVHRMR